MQKYQNNVTDLTGSAVVGVEVTVTTIGGVLATIYRDNGGTEAPNPLTTDGNGYIEFYAPDGRYDITVAGAGGYTDVSLADGVELSEQAAKKADLAAPATLPAYDFAAAEMQNTLDTSYSIRDLSGFATYSDRARVIRVTGVYGLKQRCGYAGSFRRVDGDTTTPDNGGTIKVDALGRRWYRDFTGPATPGMFGAPTNGFDSDYAAIVAALAAEKYVSFEPGKTYRVDHTITITGSKTLAGPDGGSQAFQQATIFHVPTSSGELFNATSSEQEGVCIKNLKITGGNGTWAIKSSRSYVRYEYLHMEPYNGGGIQLLSSGIGSSSSKIISCQWVSPPISNAYTGFEIDVNGGDIWLIGCTAIRGAIGIDIKQGQTILIERCSVNKQTITYGYSNADAQHTCGIRLSGAGYKQAVTIRGGYIEGCTNGVYVESCEALTIEGNIFQDAGVSGFDGVGNSNLVLAGSAACKNVSFKGNFLWCTSNGTVGDPYYALRLNGAQNVLLENNFMRLEGDNAGYFQSTDRTSQWEHLNTRQTITGSLVDDAVPAGGLKKYAWQESEPTGWLVPSLASPWTGGGTPQYRRDDSGFVHLQGAVEGGSVDTPMFTLPVGFRPATQQSFPVNASGAVGLVTVFTTGVVQFVLGTGTYVYLSGIRFSLQS